MAWHEGSGGRAHRKESTARKRPQRERAATREHESGPLHRKRAKGPGKKAFCIEYRMRRGLGRKARWRPWHARYTTEKARDQALAGLSRGIRLFEYRKPRGNKEE